MRVSTPDVLVALAFALALAAAVAGPVHAAPADNDSPEARLFATRCGICHDKGLERVPTREALSQRSPDDIVQALSVGVMRSQAGGLSGLEISNLATYLTGKAPGLGGRPPETNVCPEPPGPVAVGTAQWNGWGRDLDNSRYQPEPALRAADVPKLKLKWSYGYRSPVTYGQPTVVDGRVFVTSMSGRVYSLDARTGCTYWTFDAAASARTAVSVGELSPLAKPHRLKPSKVKNAHIDTPKAPSAVFFGDDSGAVYALDAQKGTLLWKVQADPHPLARITGSPILYKNRLYVPVSSVEEPAAVNPNYPCCTFRGSVVALDIVTGSTVWKTYMVADEPKPYRKTASGVQQIGPAGVAVWSAPTVDAKRGLLYAGTGNSYTSIDAPMSDAIVALDLADGKVRWVKQVTPTDDWIVGCSVSSDDCPKGRHCVGPGVGNCPDRVGPDFDFGASPILRTLANGKQIIVAGQKSGYVYGLDPDNDGALLWQAKVGGAVPIGGVGWGPAADHHNVYVAIGDLPANNSVMSLDGLSALDLATGAKRWYTPTPAANCSWGERNCFTAQRQAVSVMPGIVFSGALDGHLRAYSSIDGKVVWDFDASKDFDTVNGVKASGGSLDHGGPTIVDGMVYVNAGYGRLIGQPGNVLLAFAVGK
jgi:polyvinyl alcohol dehydrogenase (cytochrome)